MIDPIAMALHLKQEKEREGFCYDCETERSTTAVFDFFMGRSVRVCQDCKTLNYDVMRR